MAEHPLIGKYVQVITGRKGDPIMPGSSCHLAADVAYAGTLIAVDASGADLRNPDISRRIFHVTGVLDIIEHPTPEEV